MFDSCYRSAIRAIALLLCLTLTACAATPPSANRSGYPAPAAKTRPLAPSPCSDSLYLALKARPLESLTDREYSYFADHDNACMEYQRTAKESEAAADRQIDAVDRAGQIFFIITIATSVVGLVTYFIVKNDAEKTVKEY